MCVRNCDFPSTWNFFSILNHMKTRSEMKIGKESDLLSLAFTIFANKKDLHFTFLTLKNYWLHVGSLVGPSLISFSAWLWV